MSLTKLVFPSLAWSELWNVLAFLSLKDLWRLGTTCRSAFITFLREKTYREGLQSRGFTISSYRHHASFLCKYSKHDKILLVSYPRSGNSYVRKILELKTGIVTGSDSRPNRSLAASLLKFGYCGEGIYDQSVWVVKSHYPERLGFIRFPVHRVILVVRNPFDAIESYFHMGMTNTHDKVLSDEAFQSLFSVWKEFLVNEAKVWTEFHQFWLNLINNHLPILIVRYEDLLMNESYWMQQIIQFIELGQKPAGHQRYLKQIENKRTNAVGYNPKNSRVGKSFQAIPEHEFKIIENETKKFLELFQYQLDTADPSKKPVLKMGEFDPKTLQSYVNTDSSSRIDDVSKSTGISSSNSPGFLLVNDNINIRSAEDKFGRRITELRKSYTKNDQLPFATK